MRQIPAGCVLILLLIGCGRPVPRLQYLRLGLAETHEPLILAVELQNPSATFAHLDGCEAELHSVHIFTHAESAGEWPEKFEYHLELLAPADGLRLPPGEQTTIPVALLWDVTRSAPDLIAVCRIQLRLEHDVSYRVETEEVMVVLASNSQSREKILGKPFENVENPVTVLEELESFPGKKSKDTMRVLERLRELAEQ